MSDNPHHPGVRSLLAKFENQSPIASPPSRGRSPAASDSSGTARQLSKVRASFVTVDGVIQSNPASPLRKTSGRSDSPGIFGPKINSEQTEASRQAMASPTPLSHQEHTQNATLGQIMADGRPEKFNETKGETDDIVKETPATRTETPPKLDLSPEKTEKDVSVGSKSATSDTRSQTSDSSATTKRKPSPLGPARSAASKAKSTAAPSSKPAPSTQPKPSAREVAKERSNSLAQKPSRVSLNPKTTTRSTRGATPAQDTSKPSGTTASTRSGVQSPARPAHATGSTAGPTQASTGKVGTGAPSSRTATSSTLHRKPSSLKSAAGNQNATAPSVRRQASRPSLPAQASGDAHAKPVNEGFLARMMRPTASSANKLQGPEKADAKPAAKTTTAQKAPRPSVGRAAERGTSEAKPKSTLRPHGEKSQALNKGSVPQKNSTKPPQKKQESEKENIVEPTPVSPKESVPAKPAQVVVAEQPDASAAPAEETAAPVKAEEFLTEVPAESNEKSTEQPPVEAHASAEEAPEVPAKTEATVESIPEVIEEKTEDKTVTDEGVVPNPAQPKEIVEPATSLESTSNEDSKVGEEQQAAKAEPEPTQISESVEPPVEVAEKKEEIPELSEEPTKETIPEAEPAEVDSAEIAADTQSKEPAPAVQPSPEAKSSNVALDIAMGLY
ncbi:unnamed protein product [Penicillium olsonii]|nr:unnamed protein product [Penicillium olsonii]